MCALIVLPYSLTRHIQLTATFEWHIILKQLIPKHLAHRPTQARAEDNIHRWRIAGDDRDIRIEALHNPTSPTAYSTRSYIKQHIANAAGERPETWVDYDLPWTSGSTADEVLMKALWILGERCPKK